jgi:hypothetical protein
MAATITCFVLFALAQVVMATFYLPDVSGEFPVYDPKGVLVLQLGVAFDLIGLSIMGMKAEEDGYILAAGGYTAQAISAGLAGAGLFEITFVTNLESYEKFYFITVASNFLYFPSLILIATYEKFKLWVRIAGFIASLPLLLSTILFIADYRDFVVLEEITSIGYFLMTITQLCWAWNIYKNYKKKVQAVKHQVPSEADEV